MEKMSKIVLKKWKLVFWIFKPQFDNQISQGQKKLDRTAKSPTFPAPILSSPFAMLMFTAFMYILGKYKGKKHSTLCMTGMKLSSILFIGKKYELHKLHPMCYVWISCCIVNQR